MSYTYSLSILCQIFTNCSLTPHVTRMGGGAATQWALCPNIAKEMQHEFLSCPMETFLSHYMPFSPFAENIRCTCDVLVGSGHFNQWQSFSRTNLSSITENEQKVFKLLEMIVNMLLGLEITDFTTSQLQRPSFWYANCPNKLLMGKSVGSTTSKIDACIRLEGMRFDQLLRSNAAIITEFKKNKDNKSIQSVCSCCRWSWVTTDIEIRIGSSFLALWAISWVMIPIVCGCIVFVFPWMNMRCTSVYQFLYYNWGQ